MRNMMVLFAMLVWSANSGSVFAGQIVLQDDFEDGNLIAEPVWASRGDNRFAVVDDQGRKAIRSLERSSVGSLFRVPADFGEPVVLDSREESVSVKFAMRFGSAARKDNRVAVQLKGPDGHVDPLFVQGGRIFLRQEIRGGLTKMFPSTKAYNYNPGQYYSVELICHKDGKLELFLDGESVVQTTPRTRISLFKTLVFFEVGRPGQTHYFANIVVSGEPKAEKVRYFQPGQSPLLTLPAAAPRPTIDGEFREGEWASASAVSGFMDLNGALSARQTRAYTCFDEENLYVGFHSTQRGKFREGKIGQDIPFGSQMEAVELWIQPPGGGGWFQFLGVPAGGTIDRNSKEGVAWNGKWTFKSQVRDSGEITAGVLSFDKKIWTAEIAIPFKTLGVSAPRDGEMWRMNFSRDFSGEVERTPQGWTSWSFTDGHFANPAKFGYVRFDRQAPGFQFTRFGDLESGNIVIKGQTAGIRKGNVAVEMAVIAGGEKGKVILKRLENVAVSPEKPSDYSIPATLKVSGRTEAKLLVAAQDLSRKVLLAQSEIPFTALSSFQLTCVPVYGRDLLYVEVNASRLPNLPKGFSAKIEVYAQGETGARLSTLVKSLGSKGLRDRVAMDISGLDIGEYLVKGIIQDAGGNVLASSGEPLTIPEKPAWLGNNIGISDEVPPPWTAIEVEGNRVKVTEREYVIGNSGLPESIRALGEEILSGPGVLRAVVNGKEVNWTFASLKKMEQKEGEVTWELSGSGGPLTLTGTLRIEFDGFALWDVKISGQEAVAIDSLRLEFPLKKDRALYARGRSQIPVPRVCSASLYKDVFTEDSSREVEEMIGGSQWRYSRKGWIWNETFFSNIWVGDDERGFALMTESDENIRTKRYQEMTPAGEEVVLRVNLISQRTRLNKPLSYRYIYQATPIKPEPKNPKVWHSNYGAGGWPPLEDMLDRVYITLYAYMDLKKISYPELKNPVSTAQKAKIVHDHGGKIVAYFATSGASIETPEFRLFGPEWEVLPRKDSFGGTVRIVSASSSNTDFMLYTVKKLVEEFGLDGLYLDVSGAPANTSPYNGSGYQREGESQRRPTVPYLATREFYKRMYTYLKSGGRDGVLFRHVMPAACYAGFADLCTEGEEWGGEDKNRYTRLTPDMFRANEMKIQYGVPYLWYDFFQIRPSAPKNISIGESMAVTLPFHVLPALGGPQVFPFWDVMDQWWTESEFIPYWSKRKAVGTDHTLVLASTYLKPEEKKALVVVANWNYQPVKTEVVLDFDRLGIDAKKATVVDALSGKAVERNGAQMHLDIPKRNLKLLIVK